MRKLLSANLARMFKSKIFATLESICFTLGVIFYILVIINTRNIGQNWLLHSANCYFFFFSLYIGVVIAIFSGWFIGTEYSDGTIRNKLCVGHSRRDIYISNLIVTAAAGLLFCVPHLIAALVIGVPFAGIGVLAALSSPFWRLGCCMLVVVVYSAIFTLIPMLDSNKARSVIVSLLSALILIAGGMVVYNRLQEPELTSQMVMQEDGSFQLQENIPNSRYISGTTRMVYELIDALLPSSAGVRITDRDGEFDWEMPICLSAMSILLTISGVAIFKRKDIR